MKRRNNAGAALIVVLGIMVILLAIALTFFTVSKLELTTATNVTSSVRADNLADAGNAIAVHALNSEFFRHPSVTSPDHAWRTYFNGAAFVGKPWTMYGNLPLVEQRYIRFKDGFVEPLYQGERTADWLYIPRAIPATDNWRVVFRSDVDGFEDAQGNHLLDGQGAEITPIVFDPTKYPFVTTDFYDGAYPAGQIGAWADVDNNEDGFRDSMWIPIPADLYFDGDGVDNNLDGAVDGSTDARPEPATFVYNGMGELVDLNSNDLSLSRVGDGLDNDGDGVVDNPEENKLFLTAPLAGIYVPVDLNGDGIAGDVVRYMGAKEEESKPLRVKLPDVIQVKVNELYQGLDGNGAGVISLTAANVDRIDNDFDRFINNMHTYAYLGAVLPDRAPGYRLVSAEAYGGNDTLVFDPPLDSILPALTAAEQLALRTNIHITSSGEPVCELAGRAAILITDEASKVNLDSAGGHRFDDSGSIFRAMDEGDTVHEYDTRVLPDIGQVLSARLWGMLTGGPDGVVIPEAAGAYRYDVSLPGYGRVDDNANMLLTAMNGLDDDGDGLIDEGLRIPQADDADLPHLMDSYRIHDSNWNGYNWDTKFAALVKVYTDQLGDFEGIDEPGELQRSNPLRNMLAERDGLDNDASGTKDEIGELGDKQLSNIDQVLKVKGIGQGTYNLMRNLVTVYSTDKNTGYVRDGLGQIRAVNRLDYNLATAAQIATQLVTHGDFEPVTNRDGLFQNTSLAARRFAEGLRQNGLHLVDNLNTPAIAKFLFGVFDEPASGEKDLPADPLLEAMQIAANIVDDRDPDHGRTVLTTEKLDIISGLSNGVVNIKDVPWPAELNSREEIAPGTLLPLESIQQDILTTLNETKELSSVDSWWKNIVVNDDPAAVIAAGKDADKIAALKHEERRISNTVAGNEAIKINELMVRPVRRVEAEAVTHVIYPASSGVRTALADIQQANASDFSSLMADATIRNFYPSPYQGMPQFDVQQKMANVGSAIDTWIRPWAINRVLGKNSTLDGPNPAFMTNNANDVIQFVFRATDDGLPAGRYFLTVNTTDEDGNPTVTGPNQLLYAIKYVEVDPTTGVPVANDILADLASSTDPWVSVFADEVSHKPGQPEGWVFVDGTPVLDDGTRILPAPYYFLDNVNSTLPTFPTHTITIPPRLNSAGSTFALCVALKKAVADGRPLAINFFDFSQEPDHEYVELTNTSDEIVDVGGWELEVGIPDPPEAAQKTQMPKDPFKSKWRIPAGTKVAPKGELLLSFESEKPQQMVDEYGATYRSRAAKFDKFQTPFGKFIPNVLNVDGIGMEQSDYADEFLGAAGSYLANVTVPPIRDLSLAEAVSSPYYDPSGSVFERNRIPTDATRFTDYVDNNGDGVTSLYYWLTSLDSASAQTRELARWDDDRTDHARVEQGIPYTDADNDNNVLEHDVYGVVSTPDDLPLAPVKYTNTEYAPRAAKAWDRIVGLENVALWRKDPLNPNSGAVTLYEEDLDPQAAGNKNVPVANLARIVLQGGFLPNYPEHDGIDNDGDGGYVVRNVDDSLVYVPGTLDKDMVDNNLNGLVDERGLGWDRDGDGFNIPGLSAITDIPPSPFLSEGVDEGRGVNAGVYGPGTLPIVFFNNHQQSVYPTDPAYFGFNNNNFEDPSNIQLTNDYLVNSGSFFNTINPAGWTTLPATTTWSANMTGIITAANAFPLDYIRQVSFNQMSGLELRHGERYFVRFHVLTGSSGEVRVRLGDDTSSTQNVGHSRPVGDDLLYEEVLTCVAKNSTEVRFEAVIGLLTCTIDAVQVIRLNVAKGLDVSHYLSPLTPAPAETAGLVSRLGNLVEDQANGGLFGINTFAPYLGTNDDPPDWKAFVERRWYPGDNVVVTLYVGPATEGKVADRATYREFDVTDRAIDDILPCPYVVNGIVPSLNPGVYSTFWLPDQMGLDFYRSLERKDPMYAGDRFRTSNRWEATDGNYDDWADSETLATWLVDNLGDYTPYANRFLDNNGTENPYVARLFRHAQSGSPLRMNLAARVSSNPYDLVRILSERGAIQQQQFAAVNNEPLDWAVQRQSIRDAAYQSSGDLARLPHFMYKHEMQNAASQNADPANRHLMDMTHLNVGGVDRLSYQNTALQGAMLGQDETDVAVTGNTLSGAAEMMATSPIVLTAGQADFTPIRPNPDPAVLPVLQYPSGQNFGTLLSWYSDGANVLAPAAWMPVFWFGLTGDGAGKMPKFFPNYPPYPNGFNSAEEIKRDYMLATDVGAFAGTLGIDDLASRWPLEQRVFMYVSEVRADVNNDVDLANGLTIAAHRPEALLSWDAADGLENGEYYVYVGTFVPGIRERFIQADLAAAGKLLSAAQASDAFTAAGLLALDPVAPDVPNRKFDPVLALDVITDRTRAQGQAPRRTASTLNAAGLADSSDWVPPVKYRPGADGYIAYGATDQNQWKPQVVRVTNRFLALRVRNMGAYGQVGAITHVVLAPRKRIPGKININTAENWVVKVNNVQQVFNPLLGLPGVLNVLDTLQDPGLAAGAPPETIGSSVTPLVALGLPVAGDAVTKTVPGSYNPANATTNPPLATAKGQDMAAAMKLSALMMYGREQHPDGRYYENTADLLRDALARNQVTPLSNNFDDAQRFDEVVERFKRIANLVTVRSDVFEIIATVQAGYGIDYNKDGVVNYRGDEFIVTAEKKGRMVYERRAPAAQAGRPAKSK